MSKISETYSTESAPLLSICMVTYNHELFIKKAVEGCLAQEVSFNVEILIHDDASTDKTQDILKDYEKKYPGLFKLILQTENQKSKMGGGMQPTFNYPRAKGKYIALCEGDDFWIDSCKLQKQIDFLEANKDYVLTHSDVDIYVQNTHNTYSGINKIKNRKIESGNVFLSKLDSNYRIFTCTTAFRNIENIITTYKEHTNYKQGDLILFLELAKAGLVKYFDEPMAAYRINQGSVTQSKNSLQKILFQKSSLNIRLKIANKYKVPQTVIDSLNIKYHKLMIELAYLKNDIELMKSTEHFLNVKNIKLDRSQRYKISIVLSKGISPVFKKLILDFIDVKSGIVRKLSDYKNKYVLK